MNTNGKAIVSVGSNGSGVRTQAAGEIDLYDELVAFIELPPQEKQRYLDGLTPTSKVFPAELLEPADSVVERIDSEALESAVKWRFEDDDHMNGLVSAHVSDDFSVAAFEETNQQFVFKDASVGPSCRTCGAQSDADDLFCMTCGAFMNGVDSQAGDPSCGDCSRDINLDEIFCPWCGSTLSAN
jgi:ribosomal protein S27E